MITATDTTHIPYENIYSIIETKDLYLLISFDYATVLQKKDLESKTPQEFADFVISKVKFIPTKEIPYENSSLSNLT